MNNKKKIPHAENVVIIGGGPAGLAAAIYSARAGLNPLVFAGSPPGGQLTLTSDVENYPGFESILGPELVEKMRNHAKKFGVRIADENVVKVDFTRNTENNLSVQSASLKNIFAKSVLIATGAKALWLGLESETRLRGKGVSACATCDGFFFRDKIIGVVGGGDTAMEEALTLTKFAKKVYIIHRKDVFRASKIMQERVLKHPKIEIIWNAEVEEVMGENRVEGIKLKKIVPLSHCSIDVKTMKPRQTRLEQWSNETIELQGLFIAIGHKPDTELFAGSIELDSKGYIITTERLMEEYSKFKVKSSKFKVTIENLKLEELKDTFNLNYKYSTSVEGVFAAGDCVDHVYRQAATAVGMGVAAALEVEKWLTG